MRTPLPPRALPLLLLALVAARGNVRTPLSVGTPGQVTVIEGSAHWTAHQTVRLEGPVHVAQGGVLRIDPGTRVEGRVGAYVLVEREGRLDAAGTLLQPIELTCTAAVPFSGCWGGVIIRGNARINHGTPSSLAGERGGTGGCLEHVDAVGPGAPYGGCVDADSSGVLRFVRIEHAERGLQLQGVGRGTRIEQVQTNRSRFEGILAVGGTVQLRESFLTANGIGLRWTGGWRGSAQAIAIQQDVENSRTALWGQNGMVAGGNDDASPRSAPTIFNLTVLAQSLPTNPWHTSSRALVLERGTAGSIRNAFLYAPHVGLDIVGASTCTQLASGALSLEYVVTAGASSLAEGNVDALCVQGEAALLGDATRSNLVLAGAAGLLKSVNDLLLPDLRPVSAGALAGASAETPPTDGFFLGPAFVGAVPASEQVAQIPWFSGWTNPAPAGAPIPSGTLRGTVTSPFRGPLVGVVVRDTTSGAIAVTGTGGAYSLSLPAGTAFLQVGGVPMECQAPALRSSPVLPATTSTLDLSIDCSPRPGTRRIAAGSGFACAIADQGAHCWGANDRGQLGSGDPPAQSLPVSVAGGFTSLAAGNAHACGLTATGMARCWGAGDQGQLGDGAAVDRSTPVAVAGGTTFLAVAAGAAHSCGLAVDSSIWCWGDNTHGQLGDGSTTSANAPVRVMSSTLFATVRAGARHTCALDRTGTAHCWGDGADGQLGDGGIAPRTTPVIVATSERFGEIALGGAHTCAITGDRTARCWGANASGQLGDGSFAGRAAPAPVAAVHSLGGISLGAAHGCAIKAGNTVTCWGANASGQLGSGSTAVSATPVFLGVQADIREVITGPDFSCGITFGAAIEDEGGVVIVLRSLLCWGSNAQGQFGNGGQVSSLTPRPAANGLTFH